MSPAADMAAWGAFLGGIAAFASFLKWGLPLLRRTAYFLDDWNGTLGRPGVDAHPGVMARLDKIEGELTVNGGGSVKDTVIQIKEQLNQHRNANREQHRDHDDAMHRLLEEDK